MQPVRTMVAVLFAAAILAAGCSAHTSTDQPSPAPPAPNLPHAPRLPIHRSGPAPVDRQAPIYAVVLRQYLTSGGGHDGGDAGYGGFRFPHIFVVDHAVAGANTLGHGTSGGPIPRAVRRAITRSLADVGPLSFYVLGRGGHGPRELRRGPRPGHPDHSGALGRSRWPGPGERVRPCLLRCRQLVDLPGRADQQRLEGSRSRRLGASLVAVSRGVPRASLLERVWRAQFPPRGSRAAKPQGEAR